MVKINAFMLFYRNEIYRFQENETFSFVKGKKALDFNWLFWQYYPMDTGALSKQNLFLRNSERNTPASQSYAKQLQL